MSIVSSEIYDTLEIWYNNLMKNEILLRRANENDLEIVQQFGYKLLNFERKNWDASLDPSWPFSESGEQKYLEAIKNKYTLLAIKDSVPVGFLIGKIIDFSSDSARNIKQARLENIFVNEDVRGDGIGIKLIENFCDYCKNVGVSRLDVSVLANNEVAVNFYKRVGFEPRSLNLSREL